MNFFSNVKFLANLFKTKQNLVQAIEEYEKDCGELRKKIELMKGNVALTEEHLKDLSQKEEKLDKQVDELKKSMDEKQSEVYQMHRLENVEFLRVLINEKGYEMHKLDIKPKISGPYNRDGDWCYNKHAFLPAINFTIQEFAAKEGVSYEKLKKALYEINQAWFECFNSLEHKWCLEYATFTKLLMSSFMMIGKKEEFDKPKHDSK